MIVLSVDEIILLHDKLIAATGGSSGLRDRGLLESAVYSVSSSFDEVEPYPTIEEKAARFAYALTQNHAFVDGNKRIGILAMLTTLRVNDLVLKYNQQELIDLGLGMRTTVLVLQNMNTAFAIPRAAFLSLSLTSCNQRCGTLPRDCYAGHM